MGLFTGIYLAMATAAQPSGVLNLLMVLVETMSSYCNLSMQVKSENYLKKIENENLDRIDFLVKLHDRAEIIYSKDD